MPAWASPECPDLPPVGRSSMLPVRATPSSAYSPWRLPRGRPCPTLHYSRTPPLAWSSESLAPLRSVLPNCGPLCTICIPKWKSDRVLRGEAEGLIRRRDPQRHHARFSALIRICYLRHWRIRADGDVYRDRVAFVWRLSAHNFVAFHRSVVATRAPVGQEIVLAVTRCGFP